MNDVTGRPLSQSEGDSRSREFDRYSADYDRALNQGISVSGENKEYFASGRVRWLRRRLAECSMSPETVLDFGCGVGTSCRYLLEIESVRSLVGVDVSSECLKEAARAYAGTRARFHTADDRAPGTDVDLAFCNGVFHHIPVERRSAAVKYVRDALRPGGVFALWENNPWSPGARYVMNRIPFDWDAVPLSAPAASQMLVAGGFEILTVDFLFIFPRIVRGLRPLERFVTRLPLGAQYLVLARKR